VSDQNIGSFVIVGADGKPVGTVEDGDAVVLFNFRADRMVGISKALEYADFKVRHVCVCVAVSCPWTECVHVLRCFVCVCVSVNGGEGTLRSTGAELMNGGTRARACPARLSVLAELDLTLTCVLTEV
jgi:hypothetical protein